MKYLEKKELKKLLEPFAGTEAVKQYGRHLPFLLSGLDNKEEYKSRLAFADTYMPELEQFHRKMCEKYGLPDERGNNEFAYLQDPVLRDELGSEYSNIIELMKDYSSLCYETGRLNRSDYLHNLQRDNMKEQEFRSQKLEEEEKNFLLKNDLPYADVQQGMRDCRKWMLRNCNKSGVFNDTGSKRNFVDTFLKRPAGAQRAMFFQVEKGYYKFGGETEAQMNEALGENYVPSLSAFKGKMVKSRYNPYNQYLKAYGDYFYWSKMETAMKKVDMAYPLHASGNHLQGGRGYQVSLKGDNPLNKYSDKEIWNTFTDWRNDYTKLMNKYTDDQTPENLQALKRRGVLLQRMAKLVKLRGGFEGDSRKLREIYTFANVTRDMNQVLETIGGPELKKAFHERITDWSDMGVLGEWGASLIFSGGKWVATNFGGVISTVNADKNILDQWSSATSVSDHVSIGFQWAGLVASAYSTVKEGAMSLVSHDRQNRADYVKKRNQENVKEQQKKAAGENTAEKQEAAESAKENTKENSQKNVKENAKENGRESLKRTGKNDAKAPAASGRDDKKKEKNNKKDHKTEKPAMDADEKKINAMAGVSRKKNKHKFWSHLTKFGFGAAGLGFTVVGFMGVVAMPVTIAAGTVAAIGVGTKYAVDYYRNKNIAKKALDAQAKLDDTDYKKQVDEKGRKQRYIDVKAEERRELLNQKKLRFSDGNKSLEVLEEYAGSSKKLKDRIRQNMAAAHGKSSIYTYAGQVQKDFAMEAYRHVFLKDPDGPIDEENLLKPEEVQKYCSERKEDIRATGQKEQDARKRVMYKNLLEAEGLAVEAPESVKEARKLFEAKQKNAAAGRQQDKHTEKKTNLQK